MLDTNICIHVINRRPAHVLSIFNAHHQQMCIVTNKVREFERVGSLMIEGWAQG
jgi:predicted nucleic acid-binding protein